MFVLMLALVPGIVQADPTGFADVKYEFEVINKEILPLEVEVKVWGGAVGLESALPLQFTLFDENGDKIEQFEAGAIWSEGCPSPDYCQNVVGGMTSCAATSCTIYRDCPFGMGTRSSAGTCITTNTGQYCPGDQSHHCSCRGPVPWCPDGTQVANPWLGGWTVPDEVQNGYVQFGICGAMSPLESNGECEGQQEPCYACDPSPGDNGGAF
ncbi:MAG TPA: hypothetical protein VFV75_15300 [Candidatus Polarisedimenticolaceae bacterium]|nr:hypothetical protein [Candidatus Polarisedimenticolaceae bacterium]